MEKRRRNEINDDNLMKKLSSFSANDIFVNCHEVES